MKVKNDAVKQRMQLMTVIKDTMAKIGAMARGLDPFTEESAANAKQTLLLAATDIEVKFKLNETDPLSESSQLFGKIGKILSKRLMILHL